MYELYILRHPIAQCAASVLLHSSFVLQIYSLHVSVQLAILKSTIGLTKGSFKTMEKVTV
jgi:hypothetical protein